MPQRQDVRVRCPRGERNDFDFCELELTAHAKIQRWQRAGALESWPQRAQIPAGVKNFERLGCKPVGEINGIDRRQNRDEQQQK